LCFGGRVGSLSDCSGGDQCKSRDSAVSVPGWKQQIRFGDDSRKSRIRKSG
jgi:hypothetical protein